MDPSHPTSDSVSISRREAIRRAALLAGVAFAPAWLSLAARPLAATQGTYLDADQRALVTAIAERILPRTDTPGATDVGVPAFIDRLYGEFMTDAERQTLVDGLARLRAQRRDFAGAGPAEQDEVLRGVARSEEAQPGGFFRLIRSATILGYFTSETVGTTVLHYDPVPGRYDACLPLADVGNRNWTT